LGPAFINTDSLTTPADGSPTDSAASATAMATGELVINGAIGHKDGRDLQNLTQRMRMRKAALGLVTTANLYDASPMAFVAHAENRGNTAEILDELFESARPEVLMGGAGTWLDEDSEVVAAAIAGYDVVRDRDELEAWSPSRGRVLGVFESSAGIDWPTTPVLRRERSSTDPPLPVMVEHALARLERDPSGFFLLVENEHIDELGHRAVSEPDEATAGVPYETAALDDAVGVVLDWVDRQSSFDDTLVVVVADHETGGARYDANSGDFRFTEAGSHTRAPVAVYARGPGASAIERLCSVADLFLLLSGRL
jgi:alkaline phosphatase